MAKNFTIEKSVAKDIMEKAGLLGKDSRLFVRVLPNAKSGKVGVMFTVVNQPNQYTFGATIDEPADFADVVTEPLKKAAEELREELAAEVEKAEDKESAKILAEKKLAAALNNRVAYMKFACDATRFVSIISNLLLFDSDIAIAENNGQYYVGGGNKSMVGLDVIAWPADESAVFFEADTEKIVAAIKDVELKEFATALAVGGGFNGEDDKTRGVSLSFAKGRLIVSSTTGTVAATASSEKLGAAEMGTEPTRVCVSDRQLDALRKYVSMCSGNLAVRCGEKHIFFYSQKGSLYLGLSIPGADANSLVVSFTSGKYMGTAVFDTEQLATVLKSYSGLAEEEVALFSLNETMLTVKARKSAVKINAAIASKDGEVSEFPQCLSVKMLRNALGVLKNGNLVITLYKKVGEGNNAGKDIVMPVLSNEKVDGAYNGEILVMPINLDKLEKSEKDEEEKAAKKKAEKEKKSEKTNS